jgi:hypothetical protein
MAVGRLDGPVVVVEDVLGKYGWDPAHVFVAMQRGQTTVMARASSWVKGRESEGWGPLTVT